MLKAAVLPRLMSAMMTARADMTRMALTGTLTAGWICASNNQIHAFVRPRCHNYVPSRSILRTACLRREQKQRAAERSLP